MSLVSLNSSNTQVDNPPLYQSIKELIDQVDALQKLINSLGLSINGSQLTMAISLPLLLNGGQIKFPVIQNPSIDPNTLDDYEEGIWVPVDASGAGLALIITSATYTKIGNRVNFDTTVMYPANASGLTFALGGLPFISAKNTAIAVGADNSTVAFYYFTNAGATTISALTPITNVFGTNAQHTSATLILAGSYSV
jgi:hypothetical protein